jgi:signal transduction histidine kinase
MAEILILIIALIFILLGIVEIFIFLKNKKNKDYLVKREEDDKRKVYEASILNELSSKIGGSLNAKNVIEVVAGSLPDFVNCSSVSYMLLAPEKIVFGVYIKKLVSRMFIDQIRVKMINSMSAVLNVDLKNIIIEENLWGSDLTEESNNQVRSFFNIPLAISGKVIGLITVADAQADFYKEKEMTGLYKIVQRISEEVTRLQEVVDSENSRLNAMVSSMADGVIMTDMDHRILVVNPAAKRAVGLENKKDLSIADFALGIKGKFDLKDKIEEGVRLEKIFLSDEISLQSGFFKIVISPVKDKWRPLGCVIVFRDITHERKLKKLKKILLL